MNPENLLATSILASLATSLVLWWWLKGSLHRLLVQLCHAGGDTEFWTRYTVLMLVIAPLAIVLWFAPNLPQNATEAVRHLLLSVLLSHLFACALIGRTLYKAVQRATETAAPLPSQKE